MTYSVNDFRTFGKSLRTTRTSRKCGFAPIVTLSLMILLTMIAVGLLSLITISLRSSGQSSALHQARPNARPAMMLAIPEYLSEKDPAHLKQSYLKAPINQTFGRKFQIVSLRFLSEPEV